MPCLKCQPRVCARVVLRSCPQGEAGPRDHWVVDEDKGICLRIHQTFRTNLYVPQPDHCPVPFWRMRIAGLRSSTYRLRASVGVSSKQKDCMSSSSPGVRTPSPIPTTRMMPWNLHSILSQQSMASDLYVSQQGRILYELQVRRPSPDDRDASKFQWIQQ